MHTTVQDYVWIVMYSGEVYVTKNVTSAYDLCRGLIESEEPFSTKSVIQEYLRELRDDFLKNGNDIVGQFGVEDVIWANRQALWGL